MKKLEGMLVTQYIGNIEVCRFVDGLERPNSPKWAVQWSDQVGAACSTWTVAASRKRTERVWIGRKRCGNSAVSVGGDSVHHVDLIG